jgi:RHS repeat-associated protein
MRAGTVTAGHPVNVATGAVYSRHKDFTVPGSIPLYWERRYSTARLDGPLGAQGLGWTARYFATLTREADGYRLLLPEGGSEMFPDRLGTVDRGGVVRNLGTFQELWRRANDYVVTRWGSGAQKPERLVFRSAPAGTTMPLVSVENEASAALDIVHDKSGRVSGIHQRLERRALELEYTSAGQLGAVVFVPAAGGGQVAARFEYDRGGHLVAAIDALGFADRYEYDSQDRIVREVRKDGTVYSFRYDKQGRCIRAAALDRYDEKVFRYLDAVGWSEVTDSLGKTTRYEWLPTGQVVTVVDPLGGQERTEYDEHGRIVASILPGGETTRYRYDAAGNGVETIDAAGQSWTSTFDASHQRLSSTDPMGRTTRWQYDERGRVIAVEPPGGGRVEYAWNVGGNLVEVRTGRGVYQRLRYDALGNLAEKIDAAGNRTRYAVDELGRLAEVVNASGYRYRVEHDALGHTTRIDYPDGSSELFAYDAGGNQVSRTDRNGHTRTYRWGPCQRLLEATDANGQTVRYLWGTEPARLNEVINEKGESLRFVHDALGRFTKQVSFDGRERSFAYDASSRVVRMENGAGEPIRFTWDPCGRLLERLLPDGVVHRLTYDPSGDLVAADTPDRSIRFERDQAGRITREVQGHHHVDSVYDSDGNRVRLSTDLGHAVDFTIDAGFNVTRLALANGDAFVFALNEVGLESTRELPGGLRLATEYDADGRISLHRLAADGTSRALPNVDPADPRAVVRRSYEHAPNGTVLRIRDGRRGISQYAYDPEQQILSAARAGEVTEVFQYDPAGNLTEIGSPDGRVTLRYAPGGRLEEYDGTRYEYDAEGRLVKKIERILSGKDAEWTFTWDALNQLRSVRRPDGEEWSYQYDVFGRRYSKRGPQSQATYVWDRDVLLHEILPRARPTSWIYVDPEPEPIAKLVGDQLFTIVGDQNGTPRELVTRNGGIAWAARTSVWGRDLGSERGTTDCPVRFPGQWLDAESGLHYNRFRYYDPRIARFISQDPIAPNGRLNFYRYAPNPLNWLDPLGLDVCENREKGEEFKDGVKEKYEKAGFIVHEEVVVQVTTPDGQVRTRIDLVVKNPETGRTYYIETKASATAPYTPNQTAAGVGQGSGTLTGPAEMRSDRPGLTPQGSNLPANTKVQTVRPGDQIPGLPRGTRADPV